MKGTDVRMESRVPHHITGIPSSVMVQPLLDSRVPYGRFQQPLTIYPIDQMKSSHIENDYIDCPAVVSTQPPSQKVARGPQDSLLVSTPHTHLLRCEPHDVTHPWIYCGGRPSSMSSCSSGSTSSDQRLLDHVAPPSTVPPGRAASIQVKQLPGPVPQGPKSLGVTETASKHTLLCQQCGRCRCTECTLPRTLPSCWVCNQECLCSARSLVDATTCMCLVRGVFYHCTNDEDEEGSCADRPCSCGPSHRCARWAFMGALSLVLPCLLCYLPATGCVKLSQKCYDRISRPGCRCKQSSMCKVVEWEQKSSTKETQKQEGNSWKMLAARGSVPKVNEQQK